MAFNARQPSLIVEYRIGSDQSAVECFCNSMQKLKNERSDATEIYITGPSWPSTATLNDAPNPWSRQHWNLTQQGHIYKLDRDKAMRMAQAAGHEDVLTARFENAK